MMEVLTTTDEPSNWGRPSMIFAIPDRILLSSGPRQFDAAPDGRFLMLKDAESDSAGVFSEIVIVEHWQEELKRLVPTN